MRNNQPDHRLDRIEALLESLATSLVKTKNLANSNAKAIQALSGETSKLQRDRQATDRQIAELTRSIADLVADRAVMFEILQDLNQDRVNLAENLASIASNLAKLVERQINPEN